MLNRILRRSSLSWQVGADPRHGELIAELPGHQVEKAFGFWHRRNATAEDHDNEAMIGADIALFRGLAARCKYMAVEAPELQFTAKEICKDMSTPMRSSLRIIVRLARYVVNLIKVVRIVRYQLWTQLFVAHVGANLAGCKRIRKSTSRGCIQWCSHTRTCCSKTQSLVARYSGESELYGAVRGAVGSLAVRSFV